MRLSRRGNGIKEVHISGGREGVSRIIGSCEGRAVRRMLCCMRWLVAHLRGFDSSAAMFCGGCGAPACSVGGNAPRERLEGGQAPGHSEFAWRNAAGHLACNKPYHCFSKICCATILQYQNTTFISWQQMFLNAETLSMIPGFVREINHAFLWEGIRNGKHAVPAPCSQRLPIRFLIAADCKCGSLCWRG